MYMFHYNLHVFVFDFVVVFVFVIVFVIFLLIIRQTAFAFCSLLPSSARLKAFFLFLILLKVLENERYVC